MDPDDARALERLAAEPRFAQRYRIEAPLGRGGTALVARATDLSTGREVAIKLMVGRWTPEAGERLVREGRVMARIRHPHILQVFDLGFTQGTPYLVTELASRGSLRQELVHAVRLDLARTVEVMTPVTAALALLHDQGIVHRDLKPDNILFGADGQPRVADFGLALAGAQRLTATGAFVGSVQYAAPEMLSGTDANATADVWAVGVMLYELLSGQPPFRADSLNALFHAILVDAPEHLSGPCARLPPDAFALVHGCLAKRPEDRPSSMHEVSRRIAGWAAAASTASAETTQRLRRSTSRPLSRPVPRAVAAAPAPRRGAALAAVALLAALAAGAVYRRPAPAPAPTPVATPATPSPERAALLAELDTLSRTATSYFEEFGAMLQGRAAAMMSDDIGPKLRSLRARCLALRDEARAFRGKLAAARPRLAPTDAMFWTTRALSEEHFGSWTAEQCRRLDADDDRAEEKREAGGDAEILSVMRLYQESVTEMLDGAPPVSSFDGRTLTILLDDVRAVGRAASMQEWGADARPLIRTATASFHRRLLERGPVGEAVVRAWSWGERGSVKKVDRESLAASAATLRASLAGVRDPAPLMALLDRMAKEAR